MLNIFKRTYSPKDRSIFRFLRKCALFKDLEDDDLADFLPFLHLRSYRQGEAVFFRGDPSQALYIVREGKITVSIDVEDRFEELHVLGPAGFFGEGAMMEGKKRIYHATSADDSTRIYVIPRLNLMEIFEETPMIRGKMMAALAEHHHATYERLFRAYQSSFGFFDLSDAFKH